MGRRRMRRMDGWTLNYKAAQSPHTESYAELGQGAHQSAQGFGMIASEALMRSQGSFSKWTNGRSINGHEQLSLGLFWVQNHCVSRGSYGQLIAQSMIGPCSCVLGAWASL
jgi:hypothetical protein